MRKIGIYNPYLTTKGGGEKVCLALASALAKSGDKVTLITHETVDLQGLGTYFGIDLTGVKLYVIKPNFMAKFIEGLPVFGLVKHYFYDLFTFRTIKRRRFDVFVNNCFQSNLPNPSKQGVYMCMFPQKIEIDQTDSYFKNLYRRIMGLVYKVTLHPRAKHAVYTYDVITANSEFTKNYIQKYWGVDSVVLYPISENMSETSMSRKDKIILHVGRFFEKNDSNHHKRQDFLLDCFTKLTDLHQEGWELHLAGSVAEDVGTLKYILDLMKKASGYPVFFHFNSSFKDLKRLYNRAAIYWHATGYGSDPKKHPEKQEHFGISTVEAMSTGAIPIVINSAGQKESLEHGKQGFLWDHETELLSHTRKVATMSSDGKLKKLSDAAKLRAGLFSHDSFEDKVRDIFEALR